MGATDVTLSSTITAPSGTNPKFGISGVAITAGHALYRDATDNTLKKAIATSAAAANCIGFALASAPGTGQLISYFEGGGDLSGASGLVQGEAYFVSDTTAGAIMKYSDIGAGEYVSFVGIAKSTTVLTVHLFNNGIAHS